MGGGGGETIPIADPRRWGGGGWGRNYSYRRSQEVGGGGAGGTLPIADPRRWGVNYSYCRSQEVDGGKRELFLSQIPGSGGKRELFLPLYMVTTMLILALMGNGVNHSNVPLTAALVEQSHNQAAPMNHDCALSLLPFHFSQVTN